ncbi:hypothetical protein D5R81_11500 [Parashewanella spongiae]|uniref:Uncharacterized protein n=1 Tax=Parashewanella spongiae TaxID=342950 RepID=A0A3A6U589_9GAMM|nr:hypothetical protein [Parashewanella spongiae]MCL1079428.1 hypothetical protein [Parashewanella spongiae]RJY13196.1 hypothetical protein D5R81_11500 [Parashewanella spongiae]
MPRLPASADNIDVREGSVIKREPLSDFLQRFKVSGINRIPKNEFDTIPQLLSVKTHLAHQLSAKARMFIRFTLEKNKAAEMNKHYLVLPIIKSGVDLPEQAYVAPILSTEHAMIYRAVKVMNNVSYAQVTELATMDELDFNHCVATINDVSSLQQDILKRYQQSRPFLTEQQIVNLGVGIVWLSLVGFVDSKTDHIVMLD